MSKRQRSKLQVIKVPLSYVPEIKYPQFPIMPRLYMELMENKEKVRPELRNKEYIPSDNNVNNTSTPSVMDAESFIRKEEEIKKSKPLQILDLSSMSKNAPSYILSNQPPVKQITLTNPTPVKITSSNSFKPIVKPNLQDTKPTEKEEFKRLENEVRSELSPVKETIEKDTNKIETLSDKNTENTKENNRKDNKENDREYYDDRNNDRNIDKYNDRNSDKYNDRNSDKYDDRNSDKYDDKYKKDEFYKQEETKADKYRKQFKLSEPEPEEDDDNDEDDDDEYNSPKDKITKLLSAKKSGKLSLEDILKGKEPKPKPIIKEKFETLHPQNSQPQNQLNNQYQQNQQTIPTNNVPLQNNNVNSQPVNSSGPAPSLAEISSGKVQRDANGIRDMAYTTKAEDSELVKKRDILFKFKILKKCYKDAVIPEYSEFTSLDTLQREYDSIVRQLALDATVENYKKYLTIAFFGVEFILKNFLKVQIIEGFAQHQLLGMNQYEQLLFQIGEKSYLEKSKWGPEAKLFGLVMINTVMFVGSKMVFKSFGGNIMNLINPQPSVQTTSSTTSRPAASTAKPKMKGPTIDLDELMGKKNS